jgi:hypothetical protein
VNPTNPPMHVTHHASTFVAQPDKERCSRPSPPGAFLYTAHVPGVWWGPQGNQPARRRLWTLHLPQRDRGREEATYVCSSTHSASERCLHLLNVASLTLGQLTPLGSSLAPLSPHQRCAVAFKVYDVDGVGYITRALMLAAMLPEEDRDAVVEAFPEVRVSFRVVSCRLLSFVHQHACHTDTATGIQITASVVHSSHSVSLSCASLPPLSTQGTEMDFEAFDAWTTHNPAVTELIKWTNYPPPPHFGISAVLGEMDLLAEISHLTKDEVKVVQTRCTLQAALLCAL